MTNKLISLVLLTFFLATNYSYAEDQFLFPEKKPSVFKKIEINIDSVYSNNLPQKKPIIQTDEEQKKLIETKKVEEKKIEKIVKIESSTEQYLALSST